MHVLKCRIICTGIELAVRVAGEAADGAVLACDAPLTAVNGVAHAAAGGIVAVVSPGGAARDGNLIEVANEYGLTLIFTHYKPFRRAVLPAPPGR